jgi:electron transport complex protein RnfA
MPTQFSPQLIAALLLGSYVSAQYIGLRPVKNLREVIGLSANTALTLFISALIDWLLVHFVLQPLGIMFLRIFIATMVIAAGALIIEMGLSHRHPRFFPVYGNLLPLTIISTLILALPLLTTIPNSLIAQLTDALIFGTGAALLLTVFQTLREHNANTEIPLPLRGAAIDMLSAGILIAACSGLAGVF